MTLVYLDPREQQRIQVSPVFVPGGTPGRGQAASGSDPTSLGDAGAALVFKPESALF